MTNMNRTDRKILIVALAILALFSYFLYDDHLLFPHTDNSGLEKVGEVYFSNNDVRLKTATAFSWLPAQKTDNVHLNDSIYTGERSQAAVQLKDGSVLNLKENSLVTMNMKDGQMTLDLRYGDVDSKLSAGSTLKLQAGGKTFEIQGPGNVHLSRANGGEVDISVREGNAKVKGLNDQSLAAKNAASKIELITPDNSLVRRASESEPVELRWRGTKVASYQYEICGDEACASPLKSKVTRDQKFSLREPLKDGKYFWRVKGFDKFGHQVAKSPTRALNVSFAAPPKITTPPEWAKVEGAVTVFGPNEPVTASTKVSWEKDTHFTQYEYQIAKDNAYKQLAQSNHTTEGVAQTPTVPNGQYFYRVRGVFADGRRSAWSPSEKFEVALTPNVAKRPDIPVLNKKRYEFDPQAEKKRAPASVPAPEIRWSKVADAKAYKVEFSRDAEFQKPVSYEVRGNSLKWPDYKAGRWNVRVVAINNEGIPSPPSQTSLLQVMLDVPFLQPLKPVDRTAAHPTDQAPPVEVHAAWSETPGVHSYEVQLSPDQNFTHPSELKLSGSAATVPVEKPGTYFMRLRGLDAHGNPVTSYSNVEKAVYNYGAWLKSPILTEPFNQASIFLQTTAKPLLWLEWRKVPDAASYEVELATDKTFSKRVLLTKVEKTRFLLKDQIPVGSFFWRVRAHGAKEELSNWTDPREFRIYSQKNEVFSQ